MEKNYIISSGIMNKETEIILKKKISLIKRLAKV
jgi:hypothetical protein